MDVDNLHLDRMIESLHDAKDKSIRGEGHQLIILGGFQLLENANKLKTQLAESMVLLESEELKESRVHCELANFSSSELMQTFYSGIIQRTDSVGGNEIEFMELVGFLRVYSGVPIGDDLVVKAKMDQNFLIERIEETMDIITKTGLRMNRVHIHTINSHFLCFKRGKPALIHSNLRYLARRQDFRSTRYQSLLRGCRTVRETG